MALPATATLNVSISISFFIFFVFKIVGESIYAQRPGPVIHFVTVAIPKAVPKRKKEEILLSSNRYSYSQIHI
jgi:hypothetical protein